VIYGIEQTTDRHHPETVVRKFASEKAATRWALAMTCKFAFPGAADNSLPMDARNYHRRTRTIWRMPAGWRMPSRQVIAKELAASRGSVYARTSADVMSNAVVRDGIQIDILASEHHVT
jgi:hypothetical protein